MRESRPRLPVPGPWQPAVIAARDDLARRLAVAETSVAVTRVETDVGSAPDMTVHEVSGEAGAATPGLCLAVWLLAGGETFRYRVALGAEPPVPELVSGAIWMLVGS